MKTKYFLPLLGELATAAVMASMNISANTVTNKELPATICSPISKAAITDTIPKKKKTVKKTNTGSRYKSKMASDTSRRLDTGWYHGKDSLPGPGHTRP
jgi:hypothetical protein